MLSPAKLAEANNNLEALHKMYSPEQLAEAKRLVVNQDPEEYLGKYGTLRYFMNERGHRCKQSSSEHWYSRVVHVCMWLCGREGKGSSCGGGNPFGTPSEAGVLLHGSVSG